MNVFVSLKALAPRAVKALSWHCRQHWLLVALVLAGAVLRTITALAYHPAILYIDSFRYLEDLGTFFPGSFNPIGYEVLLLGPLLLVGDLGLVVFVQHVLGLALGVAIAVLLTRLGARRWVAALAAAPVLLDGYQLQIEQHIMSDVLFQLLLLAVIIVLTWRGAPGPRLAAVAGALLAASVMVRIVGITLIVPVAVCVVLAAGLRPRDGWKRRLISAGALIATFSAALLCYALYHLAWTGQLALGGSTGSVVYGRTAEVAHCDDPGLGLTSEEKLVCPKEPLAVRETNGIDFYIHYYDLPANFNALPENMDFQNVQHTFAMKVLAHQPGDVIGGVLKDFAKNFTLTRTQSPGDVPLWRWQFQTAYPMYAQPWYVAEYSELYDDGTYSADPALAGFLRGYQLSVGYTPGAALGLAALIAAAAIAGVGRARRTGLRAACALAAGMGITVLFTASAMEFSWRYQLPVLVLLPVAAALGITAITGRRFTRRPNLTLAKEHHMAHTFPDAVDEAALAGFAQRYGERRFAPVVVLIAAYNEQDAIGGVLDGMPTISCGLEVDTLVVVDGASDDTAEVSLDHGALTCVAPVNRGQGAALRLGYRLAAERGARYIVTTDADGQYDITELPKLLRPILDGDADFVTGSRRLGRSETTDVLRRAGTYVFAWMVSALTGQRVTDTSFGFRGMRVNVPNSVRLEQRQYQSSELLVGVLAQGFRVLEQPMTMLERAAGHSKKGNNILYGFRYARVVLGTWLRERRAPMVPMPVSERLSEPVQAAGER